MAICTGHHSGCPFGATARHWHHECWHCGKDICGFGQSEWYRCKRCQVEERRTYSKEYVMPEFDPDLAARLSSPA